MFRPCRARDDIAGGNKMKLSKNSLFFGLIWIILILAAVPAVSAADDWLQPAGARDYGPNRKLLGDVELFLVFVDTPLHPWTEAKRNEVFAAVRSSMTDLTDQARRYNIDLTLNSAFFKTSIPDEAAEFNLSKIDLTWYWNLLKDYFHLSDMTEMQTYYENRRGKDDIAVLFFFNSNDRNYSYNSKRSYDSYWGEEFAVYFCESGIHNRFIEHELLHLYGAVDLYNRTSSENVEGLANRLFPDSVMKQTRGTVDDLTAYLIGWTDYPSAKAQQYLDGIAAMR